MINFHKYFTAEYEKCGTCGVEGCVCEYCDECEKNVNPYEYFIEWNPESGAHISDVAIRGFQKGVL